MILEWLIGLSIALTIIVLIIITFVGLKIFRVLVPILEQELNDPILLKENNKEWFFMVEEWLNEAYHAYPDSKSGLIMVRKELKKQKGVN